MPGSPLGIVKCLYRYDALNRSIGWAPNGEPNIQRFYRKDRLATEIHAAAKYSFFEHDHHVLAQRRQTGTSVDTTLLATDQQRSVLNALDATRFNRLAYSPYGHRPQGNGLLSLLGFNGERPDPVTGHYHLGNGYRQFNPVLLRFNSPDSLSPFGEGGLNAYVYCAGDPVNRADPTGHVYSLGNLIGKITDASAPNLLDLRVKRAIEKAHIKLGGTIKITKYAQETGKNPDLAVFNEAISMTAFETDSKYDLFELITFRKRKNLFQMQEANHAVKDLRHSNETLIALEKVGVKTSMLSLETLEQIRTTKAQFSYFASNGPDQAVRRQPPLSPSSSNEDIRDVDLIKNL